jgi:hypothetical protein
MKNQLTNISDKWQADKRMGGLRIVYLNWQDSCNSIWHSFSVCGRQHVQPAQCLDPLFMDLYNVSTSWRYCTSPFHPLLYSASYLQFSDLTGVWITHGCPHFSCLFWSGSKLWRNVILLTHTCIDKKTGKLANQTYRNLTQMFLFFMH